MRGRGCFAPALSCVFYRLWVGSWWLFVSLLGVLCAPGGVFCYLLCGGVLLRVGVVCSRLLLPRVFLFVCGLLVFVGVVGVGLCAFVSGWCGFVSVVLFGVCLCGFSLLFCRVVVF